MVQLAGRFGFDLEACWDMTPGEFEDYVSGGLMREREARWPLAHIHSMLAATVGTTVDPGLMIDGKPLREDNLPDVMQPTPEQMHKKFMEDRAKNARERVREYLPEEDLPDL
jgi:hypothetical protein